MGSNLRRQLREALPADIKGLPRAVALEIADDARWDDGWKYNPEHGRRSRATLSDLARWTAAKNERVIRDALRNLALAGWEFRVPFGKGADGRLLYAVPGRAAEFRVPDFDAPAVVGPAGSEEAVVTVSSQQAVVTVSEAVTTATETAVTAEGPVITASEAVTTGPPSLVSPSSPKDSPSSSCPAEASWEAPTVVGAEATDGGGGGSLSSRAIAEEITAALDYRGKPPDKRQRQTIADRLAAALGSGWSVDGLALYLDLGDAPVNSPAAVYAARLAPDRLPDAAPVPAPRLSGGVRDPLPTSEEYANLTIDDVLGGGRPTGGTWEQATARARQRTGGGSGNGGTDDRVRGWVELSRQLAAKERHQPYSNDAWSRPADPATNTIPHCGDWDCDPINRMRDFDVGNGLKSCSPCTKCHPSMQF